MMVTLSSNAKEILEGYEGIVENIEDQQTALGTIGGMSEKLINTSEHLEDIVSQYNK